MTSQNKMIVGGVVVAALLGYWWYTKKGAALPPPVSRGATLPGNTSPNPNANPPVPIRIATTIAAPAYQTKLLHRTDLSGLCLKPEA